MSKETVESCTCDICKGMCKRPCWPTPQEAQAMIDAGLAGKMMLDYWVGGGEDGGDIYIVGPAQVGYEGRAAPFWPTGGCTLQTPDGLCSIHGSGFKPYEGRMSNCGDGKCYHEETAMMWNNSEGRAVVAVWKEATP